LEWFFQGSALFDSMTVAENVGFPRMFTKDNSAAIQKRVDLVLKRVDLVDAHNKLPPQISECKKELLLQYM
jgi:phospholipid/cholesterol/gamma-HCH transport system ATP-binding protein